MRTFARCVGICGPRVIADEITTTIEHSTIATAPARSEAMAAA
jgi:hypothetical protein